MFKSLQIIFITIFLSGCVTDNGGRLLDPATPCTVHSFTFECAKQYNASGKRLEEHEGSFVSRGAYARLWVKNICISPQTSWSFHGVVDMNTGLHMKSPVLEYYILSGLRPALRWEIERRGIMKSAAFVDYSGAQIIALGYPQCK